MNVKRFEELGLDRFVAKTPAPKRDGAKLLVLHKATGKTEHKLFKDIVNYLNAGDLIVLNNSKVFPAKIYGKKPTGGKIEFLLLKQNKSANNQWWALARKCSPGTTMLFEDGVKALITERNSNGEYLLEFNTPEVMDYCAKHGFMPLPPYIENARKKEGFNTKQQEDFNRYQTVYAKTKGSVAAPTAGFHFTDELFDALKQKGVNTAEVTLHVGWGTFRPIRTEKVEEHVMMPEWGMLSETAAALINETKKQGKKIVSVGTTSTRTLETFANINGTVTSGAQETDLYIYPPYKYKLIDALVTNFHLADSTPICLTAAFAGEENLYKAYKEAVENNYRFYSFGDAMLIL